MLQLLKRTLFRWPKFSLRTLLLATLVVGVICGYVAIEVRKGRERAAIVAANRATPPNTGVSLLESPSRVLRLWQAITGEALPGEFDDLSVFNHREQPLRMREVPQLALVRRLNNVFLAGPIADDLLAGLTCETSLRVLGMRQVTDAN